MPAHLHSKKTYHKFGCALRTVAPDLEAGILELPGLEFAQSWQAADIFSGTHDLGGANEVAIQTPGFWACISLPCNTEDYALTSASLLLSSSINTVSVLLLKISSSLTEFVQCSGPCPHHIQLHSGDMKKLSQVLLQTCINELV